MQRVGATHWQERTPRGNDRKSSLPLFRKRMEKTTTLSSVRKENAPVTSRRDIE